MGSRRLLLPAIATLAGLAILVSLGIWQLQRLQWKEALIARVESRVDSPSVAAPGPDAWATLDITEREYQPVRVSGRYLNGDEIHVTFTLTDPHGPVGGIGSFVMTPFETDDGWLAYVNRGFVPRDREDPETRGEGLIEGETEVVGLLRAPASRAWFMPADNAEGNAWVSRSPAAYAAASGFAADKVAPYIIDARFDPDLPSGLPQGGETRVSFPNNHLQYAATWFGLAAALVAVFIAFAWTRLRSKPDEQGGAG